VFILRDVSYSYKLPDGTSRLALNGITWHVPAGSRWAVVGSNGCGKSTLARHLNALFIPDAGQVLINGMDSKNVSNHPAIHRLVGAVMQNPDNQIVAATVEEDVAFGPENLALPAAEIRCRIDKALTLCGLSGLEKRDTNALSGGQKQRLAIAGALALAPRALVLDEATSMLDPTGVSEVFQVLDELQQDGMTIISITHDAREVLRADYVLVLDEGRIATQGKPREILGNGEYCRKWDLPVLPVKALTTQLLQNGAPQELASAMSVEEVAALL